MMSGATRRGFMAFLPGAMLGGKKALADTAEKLALGESGAAASLADHVGPYTGNKLAKGSAIASGHSWAAEGLKKLADPAVLSERYADTRVSVIDPDIAVQHSRSLSAKILAQKRRNYERELANEKTYFERVISGFFD